MNNLIIEQTDQGEILIDVFSKLASERILFLSDCIDSKLAIDISSALLYMDSINSDDKISLYINVDDAEARSVFTIYDTMNIIKAPIETFCMGYSCNLSSLILS